MHHVLALIVLLLPSVVWADQSFTDVQYGYVTRVEPVMGTKNVRMDSVCNDERVAVAGDSLSGQILGGILGAAAGSQIGEGSGKTAATGAAAVAGAIIGGKVGRTPSVATVQRCGSPTYERVPVAIAYTVYVDFRGATLVKRLNTGLIPQVGDPYPVRITFTPLLPVQ